MNLTLAIILGAAGAVLILVAAIGGGFTISVVSVPRVGVLPRLISFVLGGVLVFSLSAGTPSQCPPAPSHLHPPSPPPHLDQRRRRHRQMRRDGHRQRYQ
jgi:hypothetical protein